MRASVEAAAQRVRGIPAPADIIEREVTALANARIGRATNQSTLSSLNHFSYANELGNPPSGDLDMLGLWLCDTPCFPLSTHWPWLEAELLLTGTVEPGRKASRVRHFL